MNIEQPLSVLFVDDDPNILMGLRRVFRSMKDFWTVQIAQGGAEALTLLRNEHFDVIVSDMRMPGIDGVDVLSMARHLQPASLRIVLSGQAETEDVVNVLRYAHQYEAKPCNPTRLQERIDSFGRTKSSIGSKTLITALGRFHTLPVQRSALETLSRLVDAGSFDHQAMKAIIEVQPGLLAKILNVANSAFFSSSDLVTDIPTAIDQLGVEGLRVVIDQLRETASDAPFLQSLAERCEKRLRTVACSLPFTDFPQHSAIVCTQISSLLELGRLALWSMMPNSYPESITNPWNESEMQKNEEELFGARQEQIGAILMSLWGLPSILPALLTSMVVKPTSGGVVQQFLNTTFHNAEQEDVRH